MSKADDYFRRLQAIRAGQLEDERPPYAELQAWIISTPKPENLKGMLRRIVYSLHHAGVPLESIHSIVAHSWETCSNPNSMLRDTPLRKQILDGLLETEQDGK